mgnify:CR=1 FL=1
MDLVPGHRLDDPRLDRWNLVGCPTGVEARTQARLDRHPLSMFFSSIPAFWLGLLIVWYFAYKNGWFPNQGA